jgi:hypothetical protein
MAETGVFSLGESAAEMKLSAESAQEWLWLSS